MKKIIKNILFTLLVFVTISCSKDDSKPDEDTATEPDVYVAGLEDNKAVYWKNGEKNILSDNFSYASAISVTDSGDIYVVGTDKYEDAVYWKNGIITLLGSGTNAVANDIWITQNGDVHVVGSINSKATYWKNGTETILTGTNSSSGNANSIFIKGNSIYIAGSETENSFETAVYWKDGNKIVLPVGTDAFYSNASSIYVDDNEGVLIAGAIRKATSVSYTAGVYWKKNLLIEPGNSTKDTKIREITVVDDVLYMAGMEIIEAYPESKRNALYWRDNIKFVLENSEKAEAYTIAIMDNDVYTAGYETDSNGKPQARYWENNIKVYLSDNISYAYDILIK